MALDAIFEVVVRIIAELVVEVLFVGVFYWPGWIILRVLTLGRYILRPNQINTTASLSQ
jgi:hypothetical protein